MTFLPSSNEISSHVCDPSAEEKWRAKIVGDWLLAILKYAVTLRQEDRRSALAIAGVLDHLGSGTSGGLGMSSRSAFLFFRRMSGELCNAIVDSGAPQNAELLRLHLNRIDDPRLKRAFEAAVAIEGISGGLKTNANTRNRARADLWKGLRG